MRAIRSFCYWLAAAFLALGVQLLSQGVAASGETTPKLAAMIKKAAQEAEIVYQGPDPATSLSTSDMLRDMELVTQKYFGVKIRVKVDNALGFPAATTKALTEIKSGTPPTYDLMYQTVVSGAPLYAEKAVEHFPWVELFPFIKADDLEWNGQALINQTLFAQPAYNKNLVKPQDVPKSWDDILNSKWKGKLGLLIYPDPWLVLSHPRAWGEEKTFAYLKKVMELKPKLGRFPEVHERVVSGETPLAWGQHRERTLYAKEHLGAPVENADDVSPALLWINILFVPKGARHPNAAALVGAAMLTKEGQELQLKYQAATSMYSPGTPAAKFAATRKVIKPDVDFLIEKGTGLSKKIGSILLGK